MCGVESGFDYFLKKISMKNQSWFAKFLLFFIDYLSAELARKIL
ncbi:hypothetical protein C4J91_4514 [Pseudomonas sp. R3-52-08]|nr:hypothetical protein C4J91_4514 [Pseudomonas sp. R3-52-08]